MSYDGDDHLSSHTLKMWAIHQEIIFRWGVYTIFRWDMYSVPEGKMGYLHWFVPGDVPEKHEIITWLEYELEDFKQDPVVIGEHDYKFPGVDVKIHSDISEFSGVEPYLDRKHAEKIAKKAMARFNQELEKIKAKKKEASDG